MNSGLDIRKDTFEIKLYYTNVAKCRVSALDGNTGTQILEYTPAGKLVWSWKQDPKQQSSIQGVLVLDGLDLNRPHTEDAQGWLVPN